MTFKRVAAACVAAALSLAITSLGSGASAADPPPLDIHGFFDVTFANDYITPRGLLVTNTGLTGHRLHGHYSVLVRRRLGAAGAGAGGRDIAHPALHRHAHRGAGVPGHAG